MANDIEDKQTAGSVGLTFLQSAAQSDESANMFVLAPQPQPQTLTEATLNSPLTAPIFAPAVSASNAAEEAKKRAALENAQKSEEKARKKAAENLGLLNKGGIVVNDSNEPSYIVNARRVIINSQSDPTMIFGAEGVSVSSPKQVSIDSDDRVILHGLEGVYLGIPNKGVETPHLPIVLSQEAVPDYNYEPLVLGLKLQGLLEDLIQVIKNVTLKCPGGDGYIREDAQWDLLEIQSRLPEILSTYAFVDGYSHPPKEKLSQPRPTGFEEPDVSETGTTTGPTEQTTTPVNTTTQASTSEVKNLPNYNQTTTVTATVANNKVSIS